MYSDKYLGEIERAMVAIRRRQRRRVLGREAPPYADVLDVIEESGPVTVSAVAEALSVDQPRASRLASAAVEAGMVRRVADQADGRRALLELTDAGLAALAEAHRVRQAAFGAAVEGWTEEERASFAGLLTRFIGGLGS